MRYAILLAIAVALLAVYGCTGVQPPANASNGSNPPAITNSTLDPNASNTSNPAGNTTPSPDNPAGLTQELCERARGHWNECGSACRGAPEGTPCVMMCVQYCECGGIAGFGCPDGYECSDYLPRGKDGNPVPDAMGICKKR